MSFSEIFTKNFLKQAESNQTYDIVISLLLATLIGSYICLFYKKKYKGIKFSKMFATALIGMTVITDFIILGITTNVVLSLGMVGALSIVRFRSSIKEPVDIVYIFWAISEGIIIGAKQYMLAFIGTIAISIALGVFGSYKEKLMRYILVIRHKNEDEEKLLNEIKRNSKKYEIKSNTLFAGEEQELIIEVFLENTENNLISDLKKYNNITMASLVKYNGEYIVE